MTALAAEKAGKETCGQSLRYMAALKIIFEVELEADKVSSGGGQVLELVVT